MVYTSSEVHLHFFYFPKSYCYHNSSFANSKEKPTMDESKEHAHISVIFDLGVCSFSMLLNFYFLPHKDDTLSKISETIIMQEGKNWIR